MTRPDEPSTEAGRALVALGAEWAIRGNREAQAIKASHGWSGHTNAALFRQIAVAIEREARAAPASVPPLDAGRHERACVKVMGEWFDESHERGTFSPLDLSHRIAAAYAAETPEQDRP